MSRFGIEPEVEFVRWGVDEFGIIGPRIETAAHKHQLLRQSREFWIDGDGQRQVCHRTALVDGHLVGKPMDHPQQKMGGVFVGRLSRRLGLRHLSQLVRRMIELRRPGAQPRHGTILLLPLLDILFPPY